MLVSRPVRKDAQENERSYLFHGRRHDAGGAQLFR
jgi:hypothetical protein